MKGQQIIKLFYTSGIPILRDVYECSPFDLAGDLMPLNTARKYTRLADVLFGRSEERRVGKECRARRSADCYKKKDDNIDGKCSMTYTTKTTNTQPNTN